MLLFLRSLLWTILLPGVVTVYVPFLIAGQNAFPPHWGLIQWLALPVGTIGASILFYCIFSFAAFGRGTLSPVDAPRHLVVQGLYRFVRNPMYWGALLILVAEAAFFESTSVLLYAGGWFALVNLMVILYEEPTLRRQFGDSYVRYCQSVQRWMPGKPYDPDLSEAPLRR